VPVVVEGIVGLRKALNKYAPDLRKQLDAEVKLALKPIVDDARAQVPDQSVLRNFNSPGYVRKSRTGRQDAFPSYDSRLVRKGLTYTLAKKRNDRSGFVSMFTLLNKSRVGAIIETAGRRNPDGSSRSQSNNPNAGSQFIGAMNQIGALKDFAGKGRPTTGRLLFAAYDRNEGKALDAIMKALEKTAALFKIEAEKYNDRQAA
jgi:hypothetical protein